MEPLEDFLLARPLEWLHLARPVDFLRVLGWLVLGLADWVLNSRAGVHEKFKINIEQLCWSDT